MNVSPRVLEWLRLVLLGVIAIILLGAVAAYIGAGSVAVLALVALVAAAYYLYQWAPDAA